MRHYPWELKRQGNRWYIKQPVLKPDGKMSSRTYPSKKLREIRDNEDELRDLVTRLNAELAVEKKAKLAVEVKHAYIDDKLKQAWLAERRLETERAPLELTYIETYFLNFFIGELNLPNPIDWHRVHKSDWASFLLSARTPRAPSTKLDIIQCANRFMKWLHAKRPHEVPEMEFRPIGKSKWKALRSAWAISKERHVPKFIPDDEWEEIVKKLPQSIAPYINLAYYYGLRREETLGVKRGDVKKDYLLVERSLKSLGVYTPTKGREARKVPHWFAKAKDAYAWIEDIFENKLQMHPDTLTEIWGELGTGYTIHDLRHTFITRAYRKHPVADVSRTAGHKDIRTTQRYLHDDRSIGDEEYKPTG